jgi:hypothetical protein
LIHNATSPLSLIRNSAGSQFGMLDEIEVVAFWLHWNDGILSHFSYVEMAHQYGPFSSMIYLYYSVL